MIGSDKLPEHGCVLDIFRNSAPLRNRYPVNFKMLTMPRQLAETSAPFQARDHQDSILAAISGAVSFADSNFFFENR